MSLILSLFPGIGMLDMAFQQEWPDCCIVRGPDLIWGGDVKTFHPPAGVFDGVIGGPPCQEFSTMANMLRAKGIKPRFGNMIPEYERVVLQAQPRWFLMENVRGAPLPKPDGYGVHSFMLGNHRLVGKDGLGQEQKRDRRVSFGVLGEKAIDLRQYIDYAALELPSVAATVWSQGIGNSPEAKGRVQAGMCVVAGHGPTPGQRVKTRALLADGRDGSKLPPHKIQAVLADSRQVPVLMGGSGKVKKSAVLASDGGSGNPNHPRRTHNTRYTIEEMCRLQGLPDDFCKYMPFTLEGKRSVIGNGVPLPMGRAIARAIRRALDHHGPLGG